MSLVNVHGSVDLEVPILSKHVKQDFNKSNNTFKKDNKYPTVWYCFLYQKNKCSMNSPHSVMIRGVNREVRHFCATCYKVDKILKTKYIADKMFCFAFEYHLQYELLNPPPPTPLFVILPNLQKIGCSEGYTYQGNTLICFILVVMQYSETK